MNFYWPWFLLLLLLIPLVGYQYVREMSLRAIELEGTMSTYIGDGDRLGGFSAREHGPSYEYMKEIKALFDPHNIMNPGKKFESRWLKP